MNNPKTLKQVQNFLSKIPNINRGGCGVSALSLSRWIKLKSKDNIKFVFLYEEDEKERYINNQKAIIGERKKAQAPCHCCIFYKEKFIDCDGIIFVGDYEWVHIINEEDIIKKAINNIRDWNGEFNRGHIEDIEEKLGIDLSDILKGSRW